MIPEPLSRLEQSEAVSAAGLGQAGLRERHLPWPDAAILADLFRLRAEADAAIHAESAAGRGQADLSGYPAGFCKPIRDFGLARLLAPVGVDAARPAFRAVAGFRAAGGIVKGVWGVQKGIYFQNAIQLGDLWCDLANDTVVVTRPAVEVCPLAEAGFEELASFEQFTRVAACYWGQDAYPNHVFPELAAVLPVILVSSTGQLRLPAPKTLLPRNIRLDYRLAESFLGSGEWAGKRLPDAVLDRLARASRVESSWFAQVPVWCRRFEPGLGSPDAARLIEAEREAVRRLGEAAFIRRFFEMIRCTSVPLIG